MSLFQTLKKKQKWLEMASATNTMHTTTLKASSARWGYLLIAITLLFFTFLPTKTFALRYYQINLVVFKINDSNYLDPENIFEQWPSPVSSDDIKITKQQEQDAQLLLDTYSESETLNTITQTLNESSRYKVLYSGAWTSAFEQGETKKFQLQNSVPFNLLGQSLEQNDNISSSLDTKTHQIAGELTATLNYYLDINLKIQYLRRNYSLKNNFQLPEEMTNLDFVPFDIFEIDQNIRTSSNKLWYVDGAVIGALLEFIPLDKDQINTSPNVEINKTTAKEQT